MAEPNADSGPDKPRVPLAIPLVIEEALAAAAIAVMGLITFANVVTRYTTNVSLAFTEEYAIVLMVAMTLLGASVARDHHIRIGVLIDRFGPRGRLRAELLALGVTALVFGALVVLGTLMTIDEYRFEISSPGLGVPQWLYTLWLPLKPRSGRSARLTPSINPIFLYEIGRIIP